VAILDMNDDGHDVVKEVGSSAKFFPCDVLNTESITKAVRATAEWAKQVRKPIGGVIPAAGVSTPATVCLLVIHGFSVYLIMLCLSWHLA